MKLSFGNRREKGGRRAVTLVEKGMKRWREGEKFEDKSTSSHADLKKHCAPSHPHWHPYGRNNVKKE